MFKILLKSVAIALLLTSTAYAGISGSKHDLSSTGGGPNKTDQGEICVFCHTPHGSDTTAAVPLWNRVLANPSTYTTYDSLGTSTLDGLGAGGTTSLTVGSVSLACLSCHDGTQAMDTVLNAPGSGKYSATGTSMGATWSGANQTAGKLSAGIITNLGTDLTNDHPVGIQYGGFKADGSNKIDPDFVDVVKMAGKNQWWVDTSSGTGGKREKTDMVLYTRDVSGTPQPFVECATCHDPHVTTNGTFLRIANTGSAVCLACHVK
jgi:predicted CXXCH cytochrome family protein